MLRRIGQYGLHLLVGCVVLGLCLGILFWAVASDNAQVAACKERGGKPLNAHHRWYCLDPGVFK